MYSVWTPRKSCQLPREPDHIRDWGVGFALYTQLAQPSFQRNIGRVAILGYDTLRKRYARSTAPRQNRLVLFLGTRRHETETDLAGKREGISFTGYALVSYFGTRMDDTVLYEIFLRRYFILGWKIRCSVLHKYTFYLRKVYSGTASKMPKRKRVIRVDTDSQSSHLEPDQEIQSHTRSHTPSHTHSHTQSHSLCQPQQIPSSHLGQVATWANVSISTRRELLHLLIDGHAKARPDIDATVTSLGISSATRLDQNQNQEQDQDQGQTQTQTQTPKQTKTTPHSLDQQVPHQQHDIPSNDILVISFCLGKLKPISKLVDPVTSPRVYASIIQYTRIVIDALESILGTPPRLETKRLNKREDHRVETDTNADTNANTGKDTGTRDMLENVLKEIMENARVEGLPLGKRRFTTWYSFVDITVEWYDTMLLQYALECVHQVLTQSNEFRTHHARAPENHHGSSRSRLLETLQRILSKLPFHDTEEMKYKCDILSDRIRSVSPQQQSDQFLIEYKLIQTYHGTENMKVQWRQILFYLENLAVVPYFAGLSRYTTAMHGVDMPSTIAKNEQGERLRQLIPPARRASSTRKQPNNPMQEALMNSQEDDRSFERHEGKEEEESEADGGDECPDEDSAFASDAEEEQEKHRVGRHRAVHVPYVPNPADGVRRGPWDVDETRLLFEGIREYGYSKWSAISRHTLMGTRTKNSIKDRCRSLGVTKSNWKSCASRWDAKVRRA